MENSLRDMWYGATINDVSGSQKTAVLFLRLAMGWLFFYAGITKVLNPEWSAAGFLSNAKTFPEFYAWFAQPAILPYTNFLNEWGLTLIGVALIAGVGVRVASLFGAGLMILYYFPSFQFPYAGEHSYLIDSHIIYALVLFYLWQARAGRTFGLERAVQNLPFVSRSQFLRRLLE